ncbi:MAG: hypothetical protein AAB785_01400 [Patescibacteria group bacterium]
MSTSQVRGFGSLVKGKYDSGIRKFEKALEKAGRDPADVIELLDTNEGYCRRLAEFAARGAISMPASYKLARRIMGRNLFGLEEWTSFYWISFTQRELSNAVKFPWSEEILDSECPFNPGKAVSETHFAFLGINRYNGPVTEAHGPLTTMAWQKIQPAGSQPRFYAYGANCWYPNEQFAAVPLELRWHLALTEIVPRSHSTSWVDMQGMIIPEAYEVPSLIIEVTKVLLYYKMNDVYLNRNYYGATDMVSDGRRVMVGRCIGEGVSVNNWRGVANDDVGLSLLRKSGV